MLFRSIAAPQAGVRAQYRWPCGSVRRDAKAPQPAGVAHHAERGQRHGRGGDHRVQQHAGERVQHAGRHRYRRGHKQQYDSQRLGQGRENAKAVLKANPDVANKIESQLRQNSGILAEQILDAVTPSAEDLDEGEA